MIDDRLFLIAAALNAVLPAKLANKELTSAGQVITAARTAVRVADEILRTLSAETAQSPTDKHT
jgi:hypothetical protein